MNSDGVQISPGDNSIKIKNQPIKIRPKTSSSLCNKIINSLSTNHNNFKSKFSNHSNPASWSMFSQSTSNKG